MTRKRSPGTARDDQGLPKQIGATDREIARAVAQTDAAVAAVLAADQAGTPSRANLSPRTSRGVAPKCGAKSRSGHPCKRAPVPGRRRCLLHGGKSTGPRGHRNNLKHGIYSRHLSPEDRALVETIEFGTLRDEIRLARLLLGRLLEQQRRQDEGGALEVSEVRATVGGPAGTRVEITRSLKDLGMRIRSMLVTIGMLEAQEHALKNAGAIGGAPDELAAKIKAALDQIDAVNGGATGVAGELGGGHGG